MAFPGAGFLSVGQSLASGGAGGAGSAGGQSLSPDTLTSGGDVKNDVLNNSTFKFAGAKKSTFDNQSALIFGGLILGILLLNKK